MTRTQTGTQPFLLCARPLVAAATEPENQKKEGGPEGEKCECEGPQA